MASVGGIQNNLEAVLVEIDNGFQDVYEIREMSSQRFMQLYSYDGYV